MKINILRSVIIFVFSLLCSWGFGVCSSGNAIRMPISIVVFICDFVPMAMILAVEFKEKRGGIMIKTMSGILGCCLFILNAIFSWVRAELSVVIIVNGCLLLLLLLCTDFIYRSKM